MGQYLGFFVRNISMCPQVVRKYRTSLVITLGHLMISLISIKGHNWTRAKPRNCYVAPQCVVGIMYTGLHVSLIKLWTPELIWLWLHATSFYDRDSNAWLGLLKCCCSLVRWHCVMWKGNRRVAIWASSRPNLKPRRPKTLPCFGRDWVRPEVRPVEV